MGLGPGLAYDPVAEGELATLVTFLEMHQPPTAPVPPTLLTLKHHAAIALDDYRRLFRRVGARWLWFSRLLRDDAELAAILHHPAVEFYTVHDADGAEIGLLELDFREPGECELAFVGLVPELAGHGYGRWLLAEAVRRAWAGDGVTRVHVHTCALDHPAAIAAYVRAGFVPFKRAVERFVDPRLLGILPADCAPQVPLLGTAPRAPRPAS